MRTGAALVVFAAAAPCVHGSSGTLPPSCVPGSFVEWQDSPEGIADLACTPCPAGRFQPQVGLTHCDACAPRTFAGSAGAASCAACPQGKFQLLGGQSSCTDKSLLPCPLGHYSKGMMDGTHKCYACPRGAFQLENSCMGCPTGKFAPVEGATQCFDCGAGMFAASVGSTACDPCPTGGATLQIGSSTYCAPPTPAPSRSSAALTCPPGFYETNLFLNFPTRTLDKCVRCASGTFKPHYGTGACAPCPAGESATEQRTACTDKACPAGHVPASTWDGPAVSFACKPCGVNQYREGKDTCLPCPAGTIQPSTAADACISDAPPAPKCGAGQYTPRVHLADFHCTMCPWGHIQPRGDSEGITKCHACPAGRYANADRTACGDAIGCPVGQYISNTLDINFPAGSAMATNEYDACTKCPAGKHGQLLNGKTLCLKCPAGRFQKLPGFTDCFACSAGRFQPEAGSAACNKATLKCAAGMFGHTAMNGDSLCFFCPAGKYQPAPASRTCLLCGAAQYQPAAGAITGCRTCAMASHKVNEEGTSCNWRKGHAPTPSPLNCGAGRYIATGSWLGTGTYCLDCPAGKHQATANAHACIACAPGSYADRAGSGQCSACPHGRFNPDFGKVGCVIEGSQCPSGKFGHIHCRYCPVGKFQDRKGQTTCKVCAAGQYQGLENQSMCTPCVPGFSQPSAGQTQCEECPAGKSTLERGEAECVAINPCPKGFWGGSVDGSGTVALDQQQVAPIGCVKCAPGRYRAKATDMSCRDCEKGRFQPSDAQATCRHCPLGKYQSGTGALRCEDIVHEDQRTGGALLCAPGHYVHTLHGHCYACPAGKFQPSTGRNFCLDCAPGRAQASEGAARCTDCPAGLFAGGTAQHACVECPEGKYLPHSGTLMENHAFTVAATGRSACLTQATPVPTPAWTAHPTQPVSPEALPPSKRTSASCPGGKHRFQIGAVWVCTACPAGAFRVPHSADAGECNACPAGKFQEFTGAASCTVCAEGRAQAQSASSTCLRCVGRFANAARTACTDVQPTSTTTTAAPTPLPRTPRCQAGTELDANKRMCNECVGGRFRARESGKNDPCAPCALGTFQAATGQQSCIACAPGQFQSQAGALACMACPSGRHQGASGRAYCIEGVICAPGTYAEAAGGHSVVAVCLDCPPGQFQHAAGAEACHLCPLGKYQLESGGSGCHSCAVGRFMEEGELLCKACPIGKYGDVAHEGHTLVRGQHVTCRGCGPGFYQSLAGQAHCLPCPLGRYQPLAAGGAALCAACPEGKHTTAPGQSECELTVPCSAGRYGTVVTGDVVCLDCPLGRFSAKESALGHCQLCPAGQVQPRTGQQSCIECAPGQYSTMRDAPASCQESIDCPAGEQPTLVGLEVGEPVMPSCSNKAWACVYVAPTPAPTTTAAPTALGTTATTAAPPAQAPTPEPTRSMHYYDCTVLELKWASMKLAEHVYRSMLEGASSLGCAIPATMTEAHAQQLTLPPATHPPTVPPTLPAVPRCGAATHERVGGTGACAACPRGQFKEADAALFTPCRNCPSGKYGATLFGSSFCFDCAPGTASSAGMAYCEQDDAAAARARPCSHLTCEYLETQAHGWRIRTLHHGREARGTKHRCAKDAASGKCTCLCYFAGSFASAHSAPAAAAAAAAAEEAARLVVR
jgi:hypothetical protein